MSLDNEQSKVIQGRFHLTKKLGAGSFGEIFEAKDLKTGRLYACKAESLHTKHPQLRLEYQIYRALQHSKHFVRVWGYVSHYNHQIMIMDKLGDSLEQLFTSVGRKFSIRCVCAIAIQILTRIEELHKHHYLHRDIKPDNFLIGCKDSEKAKIFMIDLGLGKVWKEGGRHIPEKCGKRLIGTPRYASINTHFGHEQSRRDDLESLGYMLMYFANGQLPWQGLKGNTKEEKYQKIGHTKRDTRLVDICRGYPDEFHQYLAATQKLAFTEEPPYEHYRALFGAVLKREQLRAHSRAPGQLDLDWLNKGMLSLAAAKKSYSARQPRPNARKLVDTAPQRHSTSRRATTPAQVHQPQPQQQQQQQQYVSAHHPQQHLVATKRRSTRTAPNNVNANVAANAQIARPRSATRNRTSPGMAMPTVTHNVGAYTTTSPPTNHHYASQHNPHAQNHSRRALATGVAQLPYYAAASSLQLPNLTQTQTQTQPQSAGGVGVLSPVSAQQNYMDRYNRCRNIAAAVSAQTQIKRSHSHPTSPRNQLSAVAQAQGQSGANNLSNVLFSPNGGTTAHNQSKVTAHSGQTGQSSQLMADYQELVGAYKKMEAKLVSATQALAASEQKCKAAKSKCSQYAYRVQTQSQQIEQLSREVQAYRTHKINALSQPDAKRRKLNSMQRSRAAAGM